MMISETMNAKLNDQITAEFGAAHAYLGMACLLDNMSLDQVREAALAAGDRAELEASGGITLQNVRAVAETGVHRISIGAITKDLKAIDFSMRFE